MATQKPTPKTIGSMLRTAWGRFQRSHAAIENAVGPVAERLAELRVTYRTKADLVDIGGRTSGYRTFYTSAIAAAYGVSEDDVSRFREEDPRAQAFERTVRNHIRRQLEEMAAKGSKHPKATDVRKALKAEAEAKAKAAKAREDNASAEPKVTEATEEEAEAIPVGDRLVMLHNTLTEVVGECGADDVATLKAIREKVDAALERLAKAEKAEPKKGKRAS